MKNPPRKAVTVTYSLGWSLTTEETRQASEFYKQRMRGVQLIYQLEKYSQRGNELTLSLHLEQKEDAPLVLKEMSPFIVPLRTLGALWEKWNWQLVTRGDLRIVKARLPVLPGVIEKPGDPIAIAEFFRKLCDALTIPLPVEILPQWEYQVRIGDTQDPRWVSEAWWLGQLLKRAAPFTK